MNLIILLLAAVVVTIVLLFLFAIELIKEIIHTPKRVIIEQPIFYTQQPRDVNDNVDIADGVGRTSIITNVENAKNIEDYGNIGNIGNIENTVNEIGEPDGNNRNNDDNENVENNENNETNETSENSENNETNENVENNDVSENNENENVNAKNTNIEGQNLETVEKTGGLVYLNSLNKHADDSQNVHDAQVIRSLGRKYNRLMELHNIQNADAYTEIANAGISIEEFRLSKINSCMNEFKEYVLKRSLAKTEENSSNLKKISTVMTEIKKARTIISLTQGKEIVREDWIFSIIWEHINHSPESYAEDLRASLMSQIIDCAVKHGAEIQIINILQRLGFADQYKVPEYTTVCINGRVARMLSSMTLIDKDPILGEPEKDEAEIANEIYTKASSILSDYFKQQPDIEKLYVKLDEDLTNEEALKVSDFRRNVRKSISDTITLEYKQLIPAVKLSELLEKSISAI